MSIYILKANYLNISKRLTILEEDSILYHSNRYYDVLDGNDSYIRILFKQTSTVGFTVQCLCFNLITDTAKLSTCNII